MEINKQTMTPIQAIGFLRSVIWSGEILSAADNEQIDGAIAAYTALEQRVAQYETLLHAINVADFLDYENQIEHYGDGWMVQTEDGSQLSGPFDTALEAWNALKDHNK